MSRIYVAGPMTGLPEYNLPAFAAAALELQALGYDAVNPVRLCTVHRRRGDALMSRLPDGREVTA